MNDFICCVWELEIERSKTSYETFGRGGDIGRRPHNAKLTGDAVEVFVATTFSLFRLLLPLLYRENIFHSVPDASFPDDAIFSDGLVDLFEYSKVALEVVSNVTSALPTTLPVSKGSCLRQQKKTFSGA